MGSLADSLLEDLEVEGGSGESDADDQSADGDAAAAPVVPLREYRIPDAVEEYLLKLRAPKCRITQILTDPSFLDFLANIEQTPTTRANVTVLDECNLMLQKIDKEILSVHRFVRETYSKRFPELESIVPAPLDYINVVKKLKNSLSVQDADLSSSLPNTVVMAVTVAASVTIGSELPPGVIDTLMDSADEVEELIDHRTHLLNYIEACMTSVAPNLTAVAGAALAASLIVHAGSLDALAKMPSQNLLLLGGSAYSRATSAMAINQSSTANLPAVTKSTGRGYGVIFNSEIVQAVPHKYRLKALRAVAGKCGLAARKDLLNNDGTDTVGRNFRDQILSTLAKVRAPPAPSIKKPLPIPDEKPRAKRGGKRRRRLKEKYGMTELRKKMNRLEFTVLEGQPD